MMLDTLIYHFPVEDRREDWGRVGTVVHIETYGDNSQFYRDAVVGRIRRSYRRMRRLGLSPIQARDVVSELLFACRIADHVTWKGNPT